MKIGWLSVSLNPSWWRYMRLEKDWYGIFRNLPNVRPGRWGFYCLGVEFGSRDPDHWFGLLLRRFGLWPW